MRISFLNMALLIGSLKLLSASPAVGQDLQNIKVTLDVSHAPLSRVFERIESQTDLLFVYPREVNDYAEVTLARGTYSVKDVLDQALDGTSLGYRRTKNNVVIYVEDAKTGHEVEENSIRTGTQDKRPVFTIAGVITDAVTQQPIPGVNVLVEGTVRGTSSDNNGNYSLAVDPSETLVFTFIGYKTTKVPIDTRTKIDVALELDMSVLDEVTVSTNYYETSDKLKTGSIVKITSKDIENQPVTSPLMALQGRVPGLQITPSSGAPGVAPTIRIRGTNSLRNSGTDDNGNFPLYVIDGIPVNAMPLTTYTIGIASAGFDPLSTINPSEIETIQVLKDGDATAIYGSRGANGVIIITTKRNRKTSERSNISISAYAGIGEVSKKLPLLNTSQYISMRKEALRNDNLLPTSYDYDLVYWDTTRYTDWQNVLLSHQSKITDIQSNISSGSKNTSFRFSAGYHKETLIFGDQFGYLRVNSQLNVNHISENKKLKIVAGSTIGFDNSRLFADAGQIMRSALTMAPNAPALYNKKDGSLNWEVHEVGGAQHSTWINPLSYFKKTHITNTFNSISTANLSYSFASSLNFSVNAGYTALTNSGNAQSPRSSLSPEGAINPLAGAASFTVSNRTSFIIEPKLDFSKKIDGHQIDAVVGTTWQSAVNKSSIVLASNYASDALLSSLRGAGQLSAIKDDVAEYKYNSIYARLGYNWRQKYLINLTGRRDGSSRFGPGNRFGNFGAVGAGWIFSEEKAIKNLNSQLYFGKLRASYGITGSDQIGDYKYYNLYDLSSTTYDGQIGYVPLGLFNSDYAWEVTRKIEVAIELAFFDNRVGTEISWYQNRSSNQLVEYPLSSITGFASVLTNFNATVENSGFEAVVHADLLNSNSWRWNISVNASVPRNKLVEFPGIESSPYVNTYKVGEPLSVKPLYESRGVNPETGIFDIVDSNNDGKIDDRDKSLVTPRILGYYGGINNTLRFKAFELAILFQFSRQQNVVYMPGMPGSQGLNQPVSVLNRWQHSGDQTPIQRFSRAASSYTVYINEKSSNNSFIDASFIRVKTLSLSYQVPQGLRDLMRMTSANIFIQAQNLLTFSKYPGLDPETADALPPLRMVTAGLHVQF
jgi:TonB-linked SusC/RagA family outer membrane protein